MRELDPAFYEWMDSQSRLNMFQAIACAVGAGGLVVVVLLSWLYG